MAGDGEATLVVEGVTYRFALKTAGLMALQKHFSTADRVAPIGEILARVNEGSIEHIVAFLWASLRKYHPAMTLEQTMALVDDAGLDTLMDGISGVAGSTQPDPRDALELGMTAANPQQAQTRRRGTGASGNSKPVAVA
jgi:hypothetical protein